MLACAVRLLERGFFRIGSEEYAEENESYGLATMRKEHVTIEDGGVMVFDYPAKSGQRRHQGVLDERACEIVAALKRRRGGGDGAARLQGGPALARRALGRHQRVPQGGHGRRLTAPRTSAPGTRPRWRRWRWPSPASRLATKTARKRAVKRAVDEVAVYLGNTPAVCRASYIDPRVFDAFDARLTIRPALERVAAKLRPGELPIHQPELEQAVLDLIDERSGAAGWRRLRPEHAPHRRPGA